MEEFIKLDKFGQLFIDKILFESYFPIVFTCLNEEKDVFIVVCCQNNEYGCKWLLGKTDALSIVRMLRDEITIRQLLLEYSSGRVSVTYMENEYEIAYNNSDWDDNSLYLPKDDSYMNAEDGEFEEEIKYFLTLENPINYKIEFTDYFVKVMDTTHKLIELSADMLVEFAQNSEKIVLPCETVNNLNVVKEWCINLTLDLVKNEDFQSVYNAVFNMMSDNIEVEFDFNNLADAA